MRRPGVRRPSKLGRYLLHLVLDAATAEAMEGDLTERYRRIRKRFGARHADFWFWIEIARSVLPLIRGGFRKALRVSLGAATVFEVLRRIRG